MKPLDREDFIEATNYVIGWCATSEVKHLKEPILGWLRQQVKAYADAECNWPGAGKAVKCPVLGAHETCRRDLLKRVKLHCESESTSPAWRAKQQARDAAQDKGRDSRLTLTDDSADQVLAGYHQRSLVKCRLCSHTKHQHCLGPCDVCRFRPGACFVPDCPCARFLPMRRRSDVASGRATQPRHSFRR